MNNQQNNLDVVLVCPVRSVHLPQLRNSYSLSAIPFHPFVVAYILTAYWHRQSGKLARGILQRFKGNCPTTFDIYTPYDFFHCPCVVVICRNPHSHLPPHSVKTPPPLLEILRSLLLELDWKLADAMPRKLMLDSGFMASLRRNLGWTKPLDPPPGALHPSLGKLDHVRRYIDELRHVLFPEGTGFEGELDFIRCVQSGSSYAPPRRT
jgi:hypothetical protein